MAEGRQDFVLPTSAVTTGLLCFAFPTQDFILGYFQSSLRDWGTLGFALGREDKGRASCFHARRNESRAHKTQNPGISRGFVGF